MHGTQEQLDRYLTRNLDGPSLAALDAHVANCLPCSMMLAESGASAAQWERRSKERGAPNHVAGWTGGDKGSKLNPPEYMKLAGPWVDGKDPAEASGGR